MPPRINSAGFTLIEILMVVVLIGIVSAVALPQFIDFRDDAKKTVTLDRLHSLRDAIAGVSSTGRTGFLTHLGRAPTSLNQLVARGTMPTYDPIGKLGWNGPYVDNTVTGWNRDGWNTAFAYDATARTITSCGPNTTCGDADDIVVRF